VIGQLRGEIVFKRPPQLLLDVQGVGYEIEAPLSAFYHLPPVGESITLLTHLVVREDAQILYGFLAEADRQLFRHLLRVSGVGARMALAILSGMDAQGFARCVEQRDVAALVRLPGIGKKTAERLIVEMKDRLPPLPAGTLSSPKPAAQPEADVKADAISALIALGYKPAEASRLIQQVPEDCQTTESFIRAALKSLHPNP